MDPTAMHPGRAAVEHPARANGIAWIELAGDRAAFDRWTDEADLPVPFVDGDPGIRAVAPRTPDGDPLVR
jgi:hypothetical protein